MQRIKHSSTLFCQYVRSVQVTLGQESRYLHVYIVSNNFIKLPVERAWILFFFKRHRRTYWELKSCRKKIKKQLSLNTLTTYAYLAPKISFLARPIPAITFTLTILVFSLKTKQHIQDAFRFIFQVYFQLIKLIEIMGIILNSHWKL